MVRTQIQLTEEQFRRLKALANERDTSVSELIRQSLDQYIVSAKGIPLSERRQRAIAISGRFRSGEPGEAVSSEHDEYLAEVYAS
jgi:predicted transcriptional regulator